MHTHCDNENNEPGNDPCAAIVWFIAIIFFIFALAKIPGLIEMKPEN